MSLLSDKDRRGILPYLDDMKTPLDADLIIAGAGPAGLSLAAALANATIQIIVVERGKLGDLAEPRFDGREIALTNESVRQLRRLGAWEHIDQSEVAPLKRARVLNGHSAFALGFENPRADETLGTLVANSAIRQALFQVVREQRNCTLLTECTVTRATAGRDIVELSASDERRLRAKLAVAADTRFSPLRQGQGIAARMEDFGRSMLVCRMRHAIPHGGVATEWFGHGQTIAMLPLAEGMSSYVLTLPAHQTADLMAKSEEAFALDAERRTEGRWGAMSLGSARHAYPLVAVYSDRFVAPRFAVVGDAAVGMHPVTAHGYNFGLTGAVTLAAELSTAAARGEDIGAQAGLERYERKHRRATLPLYLATNAIARLYSDERRIALFARRLGLRLMQAATPIRYAVEARLSA